MEVKAPGKGADPRRFTDRHDKEQWEKLQSLPNLLYTDGNAFSLWRSGELVGSIVTLDGDVETSGAALDAPPELARACSTTSSAGSRSRRATPRNWPKVVARLCRLLRDEVAEQLALGKPGPDRARRPTGGSCSSPTRPTTSSPTATRRPSRSACSWPGPATSASATGSTRSAKQLGQTNSLIGAALRLLTDDADNQATLKTSLGTLIRVLDAVNWPTISKGDPDAWLYFYEDFLEVYDNDLRKQTGSYYTPPRGRRRDGPPGRRGAPQLAVRPATRAWPRRPSRWPTPPSAPAPSSSASCAGSPPTVEADEGPGAVPQAIDAAVSRLIGFEMQLGPFAVAQLRILAELVDLTGEPPRPPPRMFVTDTLGSPYVEEEWLPSIVRRRSPSRARQANEIKREEPITVVIGNPPYKEKAKGRGGWVEAGRREPRARPPRSPPGCRRPSGASAPTRSTYATCTSISGGGRPGRSSTTTRSTNAGVVCFITVAGFLNGPGFQKMRDYLRRKADDIWVIDCSPEGHQPEVNTRIFQGVQQPVCIVLVSRSREGRPGQPGRGAVPVPCRRATGEEKFAALAELDAGRRRLGRLPDRTGGRRSCPRRPGRGPPIRLDDLFVYNGSGVMPGRTWVIAPDAESLGRRWQTLIDAPAEREGSAVPSAPARRTTGRQAQQASGAEGPARLRAAAR